MIVPNSKPFPLLLHDRLSAGLLCSALTFACAVASVGFAEAPTGDALHSAALPKNQIVANVTVGYGTTSAAVSPKSDIVYVASLFTNKVSVIDTATNTVKTTIKVGSLPEAVALTPDGSKLYVSNSGTVSVIETSTDRVSATLKLTGAGLSAVSPDGASLYLPDSNGLQIISVANNQITATIPYKSPASPFQVLFALDGAHAYVLSIAGYGRHGGVLGGILQVDTKSLATVQYLWGKLIAPKYAAIGPDGKKIYIGVAGAVTIFDTVTKQGAGKIPISSFEGGVFGVPAVSPDGAYLYVPALLNILVMHTSTNTVAGIPIPLVESNFVTMAPDGKFAYAGDQFGYPNPHGGVLAIDLSPRPAAH
jgi:YVTN family beta-propeller protein